MFARQGPETQEDLDGQHILDKLHGLEQLISTEHIRQALLATGRGRQRRCRLSHSVMLWVVLAMGLLTDLPIRQVFSFARRLRKGERAPGRSSLCEARQRLGAAPVRHLFDQVVRPLATPATKGAFYRSFRLMGADGTVLDAPDTPANRRAFRRAKGSRGDGAFPQVRKLSLVELGTHVETALAVGGWQDSEAVLVERLFDQVPKDALLLEDRGFFSYQAWKRLRLRGLQLLVRIKKHMVFQPLRYLSDGSFLAKIYPSAKARRNKRRGIVVRLIEYKLDDPRRVGHDEVHRLMTSLLDETLDPAVDLILLYHERWEEELVFDEQKTHQDPKRAHKPAHLRSETPEGVEQEVYALSLAHFVVRQAMVAAAQEIDVDVDRLSFVNGLRILRNRLPECADREPATLRRWYDAVLWEMQQEKVEPRRNRVNPRVIKRKMSKWKKKRPEHRARPPLTKRFVQTIVMLR